MIKIENEIVIQGIKFKETMQVIHENIITIFIRVRSIGQDKYTFKQIKSGKKILEETMQMVNEDFNGFKAAWNAKWNPDDVQTCLLFDLMK